MFPIHYKGFDQIPTSPGGEEAGKFDLDGIVQKRIFTVFLRLSVLVVFIFVLATNTFAQDSVVEQKERNWSFNGYVKDMQTAIIHTIGQKWVTSNLIHNRNNFKWNISKSFTFCLEERNRFYWGELNPTCTPVRGMK